MYVWQMMLIIAGAGANGGVINALMSDNAFIMPKRENSDGTIIVRPGFFGNVLIGAVAAAISWGLYGTFSASDLLKLVKVSESVPSLISVSSFVGALLVGVAGSRWLTNETDKKLLKAAGVQAAFALTAPAIAKSFASSTPAKVFQAASNLQSVQASGGKDAKPRGT
jgi:hypothetical protein